MIRITRDVDPVDRYKGMAGRNFPIALNTELPKDTRLVIDKVTRIPEIIILKVIGYSNEHDDYVYYCSLMDEDYSHFFDRKYNVRDTVLFRVS